MARDKPYRYDESGKSPVLLIGILLVAILVVGGALLYVITMKKAPVVTPPVNITKPPPENFTNITNTTVVCDDQCILAEAIQQKDANACHMISNSTLAQSCFVQLSNVSLQACEAVADSNVRNTCITEFAVSSKDMTLCNMLTAGKAGCQLAVDPCINSTDLNMCMAFEYNDSSKCQGDTQCLLNYSIARHDAKSCGLIQDPAISGACASAALLSDRCNTLTSAQRDLCYQLYAQYTNNSIYCSAVTPDSMYAVDCYSIAAAEEGNVSVCDTDGLSINNLWACYRNYSLISGDSAGCYRIDPLATTNTYQCAFQFALKWGDPSACQAITDKLSERSTCYEGAIIYSSQNLNWHTCANIVDITWENQCYTQAAKQDKNESLCDLIQNENFRASCHTSYELNQAGALNTTQ